MNIKELIEVVMDCASSDHDIEVYDPIAKDFVHISAVAWDGSRVRLLGEGLEKEFEKLGIAAEGEGGNPSGRTH